MPKGEEDMSSYKEGQTHQLANALEAAGFTPDHLTKLGQHSKLGDFRLVLDGRAEIVVKSILTLLRTVRIAAQPAITTSEKYFKKAGVVWMGDNFKAQFLGLEVPAAEEAELAVHRLGEVSLDAPIRAELGNKTEISVSQFRAFLAGERGRSKWFVCYLRGKDGNPWAVFAYWYSSYREWDVDAYSVGDPDVWVAGCQVLSPA